VVELTGVTIDVTAQKQAELQLQVQREEMAHLNRISVMGEMTASVAHELNQPLTAIITTAAAARRFLDRGESNPEFIREMVEHMSADGLRASEIIRGIRSLVRKEKTVRGILDLNAVITDTLRLVTGDAMLRETVITSELDDNLPPVEAAPVQIQQVLLNLIMNALDAMQPGGVLTVLTRRVNGRCELAVSDTGRGIPEEARDRIFSLYFTTKKEGSGIGLALAYRFVQLCDGKLDFVTEIDKGTTFRFTFPEAASSSRAAIHASHSSGD
jgi:signal transduction histidine kinase